VASCFQEEDGKINLDYVEKRQDDLLAELQQLNHKVAVLSEKLGVDPEAILQQVCWVRVTMFMSSFCYSLPQSLMLLCHPRSLNPLQFWLQFTDMCLK